MSYPSCSLSLERKRAERGGNRSRYNLTLFMLTLDVINLSLNRSSPSESSVGWWLASPSGGRSSQSRGAFTQLWTGFKGIGCVSLSQARSCWLVWLQEKKSGSYWPTKDKRGSRVYVSTRSSAPRLGFYILECVFSESTGTGEGFHIPLILPTRAAQLRNVVVSVRGTPPG